MRISDWSSDVCSSDLRADGGNESAPEAVVDVLGGVDAKAIDMERGDPLLVDVDHPGEDTRVFGKQVIEPGKIAIQTARSEEHTSELQSLMRISYDAFCLNKKSII